MSDMSAVIVPKSDQINAEDFIAGPRSYRIERVEISPGTEQPVSVRLAGEKRVWRPCKSMSRVLVAAWGADANAYAGRSLTLYRDPSVKWGGLPVGGIRISHMSHIDRQMQMALTETKGKRAPFVVKPLSDQPGDAPAPTVDASQSLAEGRMAAERGTPALSSWWARLSSDEKTALKPTLDSDLKAMAVKADAEIAALSAGPTDSESDFPGDRP